MSARLSMDAARIFRLSAPLLIGIAAGAVYGLQEGCAGDPVDQGPVMDAASSVDAAADALDDAERPQDAAPDASIGDADVANAAIRCPVTAACPALLAGSHLPQDGMLAIDPCAFPMQDEDCWVEQESLVDQLALTLPELGVAEVLQDLNRAGSAISVADLTANSAVVPGFRWGFAWNAGDLAVDYWFPQGVTGSPDADPSGLVAGRRAAMVTWYYAIRSDPGSPGDKGVRISLADATDPAAVSYRLLLLVEPYDDGTRANIRAIDIHAGGAVWFGSYLYVADTTVGFRVFDLSRILQVDPSADRIGYDSSTGGYHAFQYKYVVPQVGSYRHQSACEPRFSFVALDRSTSPPSLVSGEYSATGIDGRLLRFALDPASGRLATGTFYADEAYYLAKRQVQGGVSHGTTFFLSSSEPASGHGDLTVTGPGASVSTSTWIDGPEDLLYDVGTDELWSCGEYEPRRYVFAVDAQQL